MVEEVLMTKMQTSVLEKEKILELMRIYNIRNWIIRLVMIISFQGLVGARLISQLCKPKTPVLIWSLIADIPRLQISLPIRFVNLPTARSEIIM